MILSFVKHLSDNFIWSATLSHVSMYVSLIEFIQTCFKERLALLLQTLRQTLLEVGWSWVRKNLVKNFDFHKTIANPSLSSFDVFIFKIWICPYSTMKNPHQRICLKITSIRSLSNSLLKKCPKIIIRRTHLPPLPLKKWFSILTTL